MNQKKVGIALAYVAQGFSILSGILYTPLMLQMLGQAEYGLYTLVSSTVSTLSVLNLGFSGCYLYFYNKAASEDGEEGVAKFNGMFLCIFIVIAIICLFCGVFMIYNIESFFANGLSEAEYSKARLLMLGMILNMAISFPINVFTSGAHAKEKFIFVNGLTLLINIISVGGNIMVLYLDYGSIGLVGVTLSFTIIRFGIYMYFCLKKINMKFYFRGFQSELLKKMFSYTFFVFLNQIVNTINGQLDKVLLGRFCGTSIVAVYSIGSTINSYYLQLGSTLASVYGPEINQIEATARITGEQEKGNRQLTNIFIKVSRIQAIVLLLFLTGFLFVGKPFVFLWAGKAYEESFYIAAGLMIAGTVSYCQSIGDTIQRAKFKHQTRAVLYFIMAFFNICISIPLMIHFGAMGAALGTMIVWVLGDVFFLNYYYAIHLKLEMKRYWSEMTMLFKPLCVCVIIGRVLKNCIVVDNWGNLLVFGGIYVLVYGMVFWLLGLKQTEKNMFKNVLKKIIRRKKKV